MKPITLDSSITMKLENGAQLDFTLQEARNFHKKLGFLLYGKPFDPLERFRVLAITPNYKKGKWGYIQFPDASPLGGPCCDEY